MRAGRDARLEGADLTGIAAGVVAGDVDAVRRFQPQRADHDRRLGARGAEGARRGRRLLCAAVAPDGMTAAAGGQDGTMVIWDLE